ncbi:MAG: hypothetical protein ABL997_03860 [Planctomycetota bacterium]
MRKAVALTCALCCVVAPLVALVPADSYPVGFDVWRTLLLAERWSDGGFPTVLPEAAFTGLDTQFADQQLGFTWLVMQLGRVFGQGESGVPWLVWTLVLIQAACVYVAASWLRRQVSPSSRVSPWWLVLLPAVSHSWLFRATELRAITLAVALTVIVAALLAGGVRGWWRFLAVTLASWAFSLSHIATPLLLAVGFLNWMVCRSLGSAGLRGANFGLLAIVLGGALGLMLRPDFPACMDVSWSIAFRTPWASLMGDIEVVPAELLPLAWWEVIRYEWPVWVLGVAIAMSVMRSCRVGPFLNVAVLAAGTLFATLIGVRFYEVAAPLGVMAAMVVFGSRPKVWLVAGALAYTWSVNVPDVHWGVRANAITEAGMVANVLCEKGRAGDRVLVTDWGFVSPLAYQLRSKDMSFTGMIDPGYMFCSDSARWTCWQDIRCGRLPNPLEAAREEFRCRFFVFNVADAGPGQAPGTSANAVRREIQRWLGEGRAVEAFACYPDDPNSMRNWIVLDLEPR